MQHYRLTEYQVRDLGSGQLLILAKGALDYFSLLRQAFPSQFVVRAFADRFRVFDWGTYAHDVDDCTHQKIVRLLDLLAKHVYIRDTLDETFALDYHTTIEQQDLYRTRVGELVYQAKPYHRPPTDLNYARAIELGDMMVCFINTHPLYRAATMVLAVPPDPSKRFDLPSELAQRVAAACGKIYDANLIQRARSMRPMKDLESTEDKIRNVQGAFACASDNGLQGARVIVIDDIYQTGTTLAEMGNVLKAAGAEQLLGLTATKTLASLRQDNR